MTLKLGTFRQAGRQFVGVVRGEHVFELEWAVKCARPAVPEVFTDLSRVFKEIDWEEIKQAVQKANFDRGFKLTELEILAPVTNPGKVICIGLNYVDHAKESQMKLPEEPVFFNKFSTSIVGPGQAIVIPPLTRQVDYEAELAVVIGKSGKAIPVERALDYVAGYTVFNDVSARDLQFRDGGQWVKGKALDTFAPTGPFLVSPAEIADPQNLAVNLWLNGQLMQSSNTRQMIFSVATLISYLSQLFTLEPGDLIATGTPPGVGFARKPPVFLKAGDEVTIEIDEVGRLSNPVVKV
jgi:2-keto-4-pentenoate hydratase/2-oxohepta-3-ene-1,7-dioic acid hydratase in catechol pathway